MSDFEVKDNGDVLGQFVVGSNISGANFDSNTKTNVDLGAAGLVQANRFCSFDGLTLVNIIVDATASNQNKVIGVALLETPRAGQECTVQQTRIARVITAGAVAANAAVYSDADGFAVNAAVTNMDSAIQGYALTAAAGAGEYISVLLSK